MSHGREARNNAMRGKTMRTALIQGISLNALLSQGKTGVNANMEDSNDKRPARAAAYVTDRNDDVCDTTSEGTHITFLGKETLHPYKLKMTWERQMK